MSDDIDLAKLISIWQLKNHLPREQHEDILHKLTPQEYSRYERLDRSLELEEEFILISNLLGKCISIQKVDQTKYLKQRKSTPPDLFAVYKKRVDSDDDNVDDQISIFIEVKRCYDKKWHISRKDFDSRVSYAKRHGSRLFFAIDFVYFGSTGWSLFPAEYIKSRGYKIEVGDLIENYMGFLTGDESIVFSAFEAEFEYSRNIEPTICQHSEYGSLKAVRLFLKNRQMSLLLSETVPIVVILTNVLKRELISTKQEGPTETIERFGYSNWVLPMSFILLKYIRLVNQDKPNFSASLCNVQFSKMDPKDIIDYRFGFTIIDVLEHLGLTVGVNMIPHSLFNQQ